MYSRVVISLLLLCSNCQTNYVCSYRHFLTTQIDYNNAQALQDSGSYREAIDAYRRSDQSIENFPAALKMAECYAFLKDQVKCLEMIRVAFSRGCPLSNLDRDIFNSIWDDVEKAYQDEFRKYEESIKVNLKNELQEMIFLDQLARQGMSQSSESVNQVDKRNIKRLEEICRNYGWPGRKLLGYGKIPDPSIIVIHSNEIKNIFFYNYLLKACEKNEASWYSCESVMTNLLWRFNSVGYNKLRFVSIGNNGNIDFEKSYFQLYTLMLFLKNNPQKKIQLLAFYHNSNLKFNSSFKVQLQSIKQFLVENGIELERILINEKLFAKGTDSIGSYYLGHIFI